MKRRFILSFCLMAAIGFVLIGCDDVSGNLDDDDSEETKTGNPQDSSYDVYVAGSYSNGTVNVPCYWKNGVKTDLPLTAGANSGWASKIVVVDNDIYVIGSLWNVGDCYWKNGTVSVLSDGGSTIALDIAVLNGDIYIAGVYYSGGEVACYWKNGVKTDLPIAEGGRNSSAHAISVSGNSVYIVGGYDQPIDDWSSKLVCCYWKDGVRTDIAESISYPCLAVVGDDIFIAGNDNDTESGSACLWNKGNVSILSIPTESQVVTSSISIAVSNSDVYISGSYDNGWAGGNINDRQVWACYWKNGELTTLPGSTDGRDSSASAIFVIADDVFIAGAVDVFNNFGGGPSTSTACYWKNGVRTDLAENAGANDIVVVAKN